MAYYDCLSHSPAVKENCMMTSSGHVTSTKRGIDNLPQQAHKRARLSVADAFSVLPFATSCHHNSSIINYDPPMSCDATPMMVENSSSTPGSQFSDPNSTMVASYRCVMSHMF